MTGDGNGDGGRNILDTPMLRRGVVAWGEEILLEGAREGLGVSAGAGMGEGEGGLDGTARDEDISRPETPVAMGAGMGPHEEEGLRGETGMQRSPDPADDEEPVGLLTLPRSGTRRATRLVSSSSFTSVDAMLGAMEDADMDRVLAAAMDAVA